MWDTVHYSFCHQFVLSNELFWIEFSNDSNRVRDIRQKIFTGKNLYRQKSNSVGFWHMNVNCPLKCSGFPQLMVQWASDSSRSMELLFRVQKVHIWTISVEKKEFSRTLFLTVFCHLSLQTSLQTLCVTGIELIWGCVLSWLCLLETFSAYFVNLTVDFLTSLLSIVPGSKYWPKIFRYKGSNGGQN